MPDRYLTQDGAGTKDGLSYANAKAVSEYGTGWFLTDFSAGDTIYVCGTITGLDFGASHVAFPQIGAQTYTWAFDHPDYPGNIVLTSTNYYGMYAYQTTGAWTIRGLKVSGTPASGAIHGGVYLYQCQNFTISGGTLSCAGEGIYLLDPKNGKVENVTRTGGARGIFITGHAAANDALNNRVSACTISGCSSQGIKAISYAALGEVSGLTITGNTCSDNGDGIYLTGVSGAYIGSNTCSDNETTGAGQENYGIAVQQSQNVAVVANRVSGGASGSSGIEIWGGTGPLGDGNNDAINSSGCRITANSVSGYTIDKNSDTAGGNGIKAATDESDDCIIDGNTISGCLRGVRIGDNGGTMSYLANNTITDCSIAVLGGYDASSAVTKWAIANNDLDCDTWYDEQFDTGNSLAFSGNSYKAGGSATYEGTTYTSAATMGDTSVDVAGWIPNIRASDDLPIPLHPDVGSVQDRTAAGRRFGAGGGTL